MSTCAVMPNTSPLRPCGGGVGERGHRSDFTLSPALSHQGRGGSSAVRRRSLTGLRKQAGQAMIEYAIVLAFGVIILIQGGANAPVKQLATAIKDYHEDYGYAMAIAYIPECDYQLAYDKSAGLNDIATLTGGITVGFDRCIDWQNPKVPSLAVSGSLAFDMVGNVGEAIKKIITDTVEGSIKSFIDPSKLFSKVTFSVSDFF